MIISSIILAFSSSIDSLGIGITYGIKNTIVSNTGKLLLFFISFVTALISLYFGNSIRIFLSEFMAKLLGSMILIIIGGSVLFSNLKKDGKKFNLIRNSTCYDIDNSKTIDFKESLFLGFALSIDNFCIGIGASIIGINYTIFPVLVSFFQFILLNFGNYLGRKIYKLNVLNNFPYSIISGIILILIGIFRFFYK